VAGTVAVGHGAYALWYNSANDEIYCVNWADGSVSVIDGATNVVVSTVTVGMMPTALTWNPIQNRTYVANWASSSVSVLRDSGGGVEEAPSAEVQTPSFGPTVLSGASGVKRLASCVVFDAMGRRTVNPRSGVYFVRQASGVERDASGVTKVVIQR
jgi:YVTN family beta-propeller protein